MAACANADCRPALEVDMKLLGAALLGLVVGVLGSWMYMDGRLQPALQRIVQAESARDLSVKAAKVFEEQLQGAKQAADKFQAAVKAAEQAASEAKDQLKRALSDKQAAEQSASEAKAQLTQAVTAKEAAERELAEAKKPQ
jgi:septal ring factor EnvC (AmiA/AmiB activator)